MNATTTSGQRRTYRRKRRTAYTTPPDYPSDQTLYLTAIMLVAELSMIALAWWAW